MSDTVVDVPSGMETDAGLSPRVKSGVAGGGGEAFPPAPPPHPCRSADNNKSSVKLVLRRSEDTQTRIRGRLMNEDST